MRLCVCVTTARKEVLLNVFVVFVVVVVVVMMMVSSYMSLARFSSGTMIMLSSSISLGVLCWRSSLIVVKILVFPLTFSYTYLLFAFM